MRVSIEQDLCTSCGLCEEIDPAVFFLHTDSLAHVKEVSEDRTVADHLSSGAPKRLGKYVTTSVAGEHVPLAIEAAEECPAECIYLYENDEVDADGVVLQLPAAVAD